MLTLMAISHKLAVLKINSLLKLVINTFAASLSFSLPLMNHRKLFVSSNALIKCNL